MSKITGYRSPVYSAEGENQIDLEILTDKHGWIPTTIVMDDDDQEPHIIQIKEWLIANMDDVAAFVPPPPLSANELADIDRRLEYPTIEDQLDMIFHDMEGGTKLWQDKMRAIKAKHPKV